MTHRDTRPAVGRPALRLRALSPAPLDSECHIPAEGLVIGRDPDQADVVLYSARISRQHCRIRAAGKGWQIEDLDSTNGVYVNGERIEQDRMLSVGDVIGLGRADPPDFELVTSRGSMRSLTLPPAERWVIGRALDCDIALPADPTVSQYHAELSCENGQLVARDLGSLNGMRIDGRNCARQSLQTLEGEEWLELGNSRLAVLRLDNGGLLVTIAGRSPGLRLETRGLVDSRTGVKNLELAIEPGRLTGLQASDRRRASALLELLAGRRQPESGHVLYDEIPVEAAMYRKCHRIGHVDLLSPLDAGLTVWQHLNYTAELRLPADMKPDRRQSLLGTTLAQLGLGRLRNVRIGRLDIAHRRLVAIAAELVTRPALLCLDRPLDGLDDEQAHKLFKRLKQLARTGTTVIVTGVEQSADTRLDQLIDIDQQAPSEQRANRDIAAGAQNATSRHRAQFSPHRIRTLFKRQCRLRLLDPGMLTLYLLLPVLLTLAASTLAGPHQPLETVMMMVAMATAIFTAAPEIGADRWRLRHEVLAGILPGEDLLARLTFLWLVATGQVLLVGGPMAWLSGMAIAEGTAMVGVMSLVSFAAAAMGLMLGTIDPTRARLVMPLAASLVVLQWIVATEAPPAGGEISGWLFGRIRELLPAWWGMELFAAHQIGLEQEPRRAIRAAAFLTGQVITWMLIARGLLGRRLRLPVR
jgi:pSer/pThr/pTyr-binding forkhead associated (FHA) protein/ABC-type transport system involved in cytochrome c biogenesis ATPase subunit